MWKSNWESFPQGSGWKWKMIETINQSTWFCPHQKKINRDPWRAMVHKKKKHHLRPTDQGSGPRTVPGENHRLLMEIFVPPTGGYGTPSKWPEFMAYTWGVILTGEPSSKVHLATEDQAGWPGGNLRFRVPGMFQRTTLLQLDTGPKPTNLWVRVTGEHLTITKKIWIHFLVNIEITKCLETQTKSHVLRKNINIKKKSMFWGSRLAWGWGDFSSSFRRKPVKAGSLCCVTRRQKRGFWRPERSSKCRWTWGLLRFCRKSWTVIHGVLKIGRVFSVNFVILLAPHPFLINHKSSWAVCECHGPPFRVQFWWANCINFGRRGVETLSPPETEK